MSFTATKIKIDRAKTHLKEIQSAVASYFGRGGAIVRYELADEMGPNIGAFTYRQNEPVPIDWPAIVGDVIHNLRTSLDLAAGDVYRLSSSDQSDINHVYYPFCKTSIEFNKAIKQRRLHHSKVEFLEIIKRTAPYADGNKGLWALHQLDILDKHQILIPMVSVVALDWPVEIKQGSNKFSSSLAKDGQRLIMFPKTFAKLPIGTPIKADFSIVFDSQAGIFRGAEVISQLTECVRAVEGILTALTAAAAGTPVQYG